jgi:hypothetical protein
MGPSMPKSKSAIAIIQRFMMRIFRRVDNAKEIVALQDARNIFDISRTCRSSR